MIDRSLVVGLFAIAIIFGGDQIYGRSKLGGGDTVYDFMKSDVEAKVEFQMRMCKNGACLPIRHWRCGFDNGPSAVVDQCFETLLKLVEPWEKLDRLRKFCGARFAEFVDERYSKPTDCKAAGGEWGVKSSVPVLQAREH